MPVSGASPCNFPMLMAVLSSTSTSSRERERSRTPIPRRKSALRYTRHVPGYRYVPEAPTEAQTEAPAEAQTEAPTEAQTEFLPFPTRMRRCTLVCHYCNERLCFNPLPCADPQHHCGLCSDPGEKAPITIPTEAPITIDISCSQAAPSQVPLSAGPIPPPPKHQEETPTEAPTIEARIEEKPRGWYIKRFLMGPPAPLANLDSFCPKPPATPPPWFCFRLSQDGTYR